jgi:hypothetical protein
VFPLSSNHQERQSVRHPIVVSAIGVLVSEIGEHTKGVWSGFSVCCNSPTPEFRHFFRHSYEHRHIRDPQVESLKQATSSQCCSLSVEQCPTSITSLPQYNVPTAIISARFAELSIFYSETLMSLLVIEPDQRRPLLRLQELLERLQALVPFEEVLGAESL